MSRRKNQFVVWEERRQRGMKLLAEGMREAEVAKTLGVVRQTVSNWKARGEGEEARIVPVGRPEALSADQRQKLEAILERGALDWGFPTEVWTGERVAFVIEKEFGIKLHPKSIPPILRRWGWSRHKPKKQARERDEKRIEEWKKKDWPRILER